MHYAAISLFEKVTLQRRNILAVPCSDGSSVPETQFWKCHGEMGSKAKLKKLFKFFGSILLFDDFSK